MLSTLSTMDLDPFFNRTDMKYGMLTNSKMYTVRQLFLHIHAQLVLSIAGDAAYTVPVQGYLRQWFPGGTVQYTPKGLAWRQQWGPNRYAGITQRHWCTLESILWLNDNRFSWAINYFIIEFINSCDNWNIQYTRLDVHFGSPEGLL